MTERPSKMDLKQKVKDSHEWLLSLLSCLSKDQMETSIVQGERSVRDILAHITAWNMNGIVWIQYVANGRRPVLPMEGLSIEERPARFAQLNKEIHERNQNIPIDVVLKEFHEKLEQLLDEIEKVDEESLDLVFQFEWMNAPVPAWQIITWRFYHCQSHGKHIESWLSTIAN